MQHSVPRGKGLCVCSSYSCVGIAEEARVQSQLCVGVGDCLTTLSSPAPLGSSINSHQVGVELECVTATPQLNIGLLESSRMCKMPPSEIWF